ncbi:MAG: flagellin [Fibrobacterales bacterium]
MRINHNISALITQNSLNSANNALGDSLHKLSTGLRINRASDDAAGLSVSEQLRSQIRGNNRARHNAEDGVALLQVAEGAMNEAHSILQRQRQLAIQSASDTLTDEDRSYIDQEFTALSEELTRINDATQYNGIQVLRGGADNAEELIDKLTNDWLPGAAATVQNAYSNLSAFGNLHVTGENMDGEAGLLATGGSDGTQAVINLDLDDFNAQVTGDANADGPMNHLGNVFSAQDILSHEMTHALQYINGHQPPTWFSEGAAEASNAGGESRVTSLLAGSYANTAAIIAASSFASGGSIDHNTWSGSDEDYATAYLAAMFIQNGAGSIDDIYGTTISGSAQLEANITATFGGTYAAFEAGFLAQNLNTGDPAYASAFGDQVGTTITGEGFTGVSFDIGEALQMHIGANAVEDVDTMDLDGLGSVSGGALGVDAASVGSRTGAHASIGVVGTAISTVSTKRSDVGAHINRLEHSIQNLHNQEFNQQDAESRIRDVDFATESTAFTKQQILTQSATAMLSQANGVSNAALTLIG